MTNFLYSNLLYPPSTIAGVMGPPQAGKSLYALHLGYHVATENKGNVLILVTEEGSDAFYQLWAERFKSTYPNVRLYTHTIVSIEQLLQTVGIIGQLVLGKGEAEGDEVKKKPKHEWITTDINIAGSALMKEVKENNIVYLAVDSLTTPFSFLASGGRQNLPLRAQLEEIFFNALSSIASVKPLYIFTTNHISLDPTNPYLSREQILLKGGKIIGHYTKILFYLEPKPKPHGYRLLWIARYPTLPEWQYYISLLITDNGYRPITKDEAQQLKKVKSQEELG